ncbi:TetR family transcriptional regulator [Actinophytocola sp.]|uniref:acyl-CoA-like ligand-binding transcription factor n=1 Tax=Actinophytocola sp. TaxID=1872138 RepID=UPI002ED5BD9D
MTSAAGSKGGLRERKKARTKLAIQGHAIRLFRERGFAATTVEQVAEAAEVSPSTVFRYFPTKEDLVVNDDYDPIIFAAFVAQPPELNLIQAWRAAMWDGMAQMTEDDLTTQLDRGRLLLSVPELWGATLHSIRDTMATMTRLSAERLGRPTDDPAVQATVGAIFGVLLTTSLEWVRSEDTDILSSIENALTQLDDGLLR